MSEFLDVFYCGHVTYQIWAWFETFKGNVNRTNTLNFDAHWTSGAKKRRFSHFFSNRLVVKFLPPYMRFATKLLHLAPRESVGGLYTGSEAF